MTRPSNALMPIPELVALLTSSIESLASELLPDGQRRGHEWIAPSRWGGSARSLSVHLVGGKAGVWRDFATGDKGGDALDLVAELLCSGNKTDAVRWSRAWLGLDGASAASLEKKRAEAQVTSSKNKEAAAADQENRRKAARAMWLGASPIENTPAAAYLAGRGIDLAALPGIPRALRFAPDCWNKESGVEMPAMVAAINNAEGEHIATHRTWIAQREGKWRKADLLYAKSTLGTYSGGWIKLSRSVSRVPWGDVTGSDVVAIAEGIENALSVAQLVPEWRVISAVSLSNLGGIRLPKAVRQVVVCGDNDKPGSAADAALKKALAHLTSSGCSVRLARPDLEFKDWNDQLQAELAG